MLGHALFTPRAINNYFILRFRISSNPNIYILMVISSLAGVCIFKGLNVKKFYPSKFTNYDFFMHYSTHLGLTGIIFTLLVFVFPVASVVAILSWFVALVLVAPVVVVWPVVLLLGKAFLFLPSVLLIILFMLFNVSSFFYESFITTNKGELVTDDNEVSLIA